MSIDAAIVLDSAAPHGGRITTFQLKYPYMIHAELMTHRAFSRNASSTRAIPFSRMLRWVMDDPAMPIHWGRNRKGMQAGDELGPNTRNAAMARWLMARDAAVEHATKLDDLDVHKSISNRLLLPFMHINVVVTATDFMNWFALRCDPAADTLIQALAVRMARLHRDSVPHALEAGMWHLPYVTDEEHSIGLDILDLAKISTARCGRVSLRTLDGKAPDVADDIRWHDERLDQGHWSPFEHPAEASQYPDTISGNFRGFWQYRQMLPRSVHRSFDFATLDRFGDRGYIA